MKTLENDSDWQFVTLGDQQNFGIRTAGLEDKATACQMLVCYARELKEGFSPYTKEVGINFNWTFRQHILYFYLFLRPPRVQMKCFSPNIKKK